MPRASKQDPSSAAPRRSRRIASREASQETDNLVSLPYSSVSRKRKRPMPQQQLEPVPESEAEIKSEAESEPVPAAAVAVVQSVEQEEEEEEAKSSPLSPLPPARSPSPSPTSEPEPATAPEPVAVFTKSPASAPSPSPAASTAWDTEDVVFRIVRRNQFELIAELTEWQCKAVCYSLAEQNRTQAIELVKLKEDVKKMSDQLDDEPIRPISSNIINRQLLAKFREEFDREQEAKAQAQAQVQAQRAPEASPKHSVIAQATEPQDFIIEQEQVQSALSPFSSSSFDPSLVATPLALAKTAVVPQQHHHQQEGEEAAAPAAAQPSPIFPHAATPAPSGWRRFIDFIGSPFVGRKRNADDMEEQEQLHDRIFTQPRQHELEREQKRIRMDTPGPRHGEDPYMMSGALPASSIGEEEGEEESSFGASALKFSITKADEQSSPTRRGTTKVSHHKQPKSRFVMPSTRDFNVPTSLSTITEYTELEPTPSKPRCITPSPPRSNTPVLPATSPAPQSVVEEVENTPRRPRRWSERRRENLKRKAPETDPFFKGWEGVHRESGFMPISGSKKLSWETGAAPPQPRVKNADERLAKIRRFRSLQRELEEFSRDQDIIDIVTHKTKRVKVDHLTSIPHNLPGDASSTFRVPDVDSDSEMSVGELDLLNNNMFMKPEEEAHEHAGVQQEFSSSAPKAVQAADPAPAVEPKPVPPPSVPTVKWNFPDVGLLTSGYQVTEEFTCTARGLFEEGFATWLAQRQ